MAKKDNIPNGLPELKADLKNKTLGRLYIFHGEETFLLNHYLGQIRKQLLDPLTDQCHAFLFRLLCTDNSPERTCFRRLFRCCTCQRHMQASKFRACAYWHTGFRQGDCTLSRGIYRTIPLLLSLLLASLSYAKILQTESRIIKLVWMLCRGAVYLMQRYYKLMSIKYYYAIKIIKNFACVI